MTQGQVGWGKKGIVGRNPDGGRECAVLGLGRAMVGEGHSWGGTWLGRTLVEEGRCLRRIVGQRGEEGMMSEAQVQPNGERGRV